jgi:hypothetical protein
MQKIEVRPETEIVLPDQALCDRDCSNAAVYSYVWSWGATGTCCAQHAAVLQQTAVQLERTIQLHPMQHAPQAPMTRDERTKLKATALVVAEELEEAKARGLEFYRMNNQLVRENAALNVREREAKAQLKDRDAELEQLRAKLLERDGEHGELVNEIARLRVLETLVNAPEGDEEGARMAAEIVSLRSQLAKQYTEGGQAAVVEG